MQFERAFVPLKSYLGDNVLATPALDALMHRGQVTLETTGTVAELLWGPERNFEWGPRARSIRETVQLAKELKKKNFPAAVLISRSIRSALVCKLAQIPVRIGHDTEFRGPLLTHRVKYDPLGSEMASYADLLKHLDIDVPILKSVLYAKPEDIEATRPFLSEATIAVQPGASGAFKQIQPEMLRAVIELLVARGEKVALIGGKEEEGECLPFAEMPGVVNWAGKFKLGQMKAVLGGMKLTLGGDTGLMHIAASMGCPTLTVFSKLPASKWGHAYAPHRFLESPGGDTRNLNQDLLLKTVGEML